MKSTDDFPFEKARRISGREVRTARQAIAKELGVKRPPRGRPPKVTGKYRMISIRLHPQVLSYVKREARRRGIGYQTFINAILLESAA